MFPNQLHCFGREERRSLVAGDTQTVIDIIYRVLQTERNQRRHDGEALGELRQLRIR